MRVGSVQLASLPRRHHQLSNHSRSVISFRTVIPRSSSSHPSSSRSSSSMATSGEFGVTWDGGPGYIVFPVLSIAGSLYVIVMVKYSGEILHVPQLIFLAIADIFFSLLVGAPTPKPHPLSSSPRSLTKQAPHFLPIVIYAYFGERERGRGGG